MAATSKKYQPLNLADIIDDIPSDSATARPPGCQTACAGIEIRSLKVKWRSLGAFGDNEDDNVAGKGDTIKRDRHRLAPPQTRVQSGQEMAFADSGNLSSTFRWGHTWTLCLSWLSLSLGAKPPSTTTPLTPNQPPLTPLCPGKYRPHKERALSASFTASVSTPSEPGGGCKQRCEFKCHVKRGGRKGLLARAAT